MKQRMKHRAIWLLLVLIFSITGIESLRAQQNTNEKNETIFVWGGDINLKFVQYIVDLTKKDNPKICYLLTIRIILSIGVISVTR